MPIRPLRVPEDIDAFAGVVTQGFQYPDHPEWSMQSDDVEIASDMARSLRRLGPLLAFLWVLAPGVLDAFQGFVWEDEGRMMGTALVSRIGSSNRFEVSTVAVLPGFRGRGIARALVEACVTSARKRGGTSVELSVIDGNIPAIRLYESMGFVRFSGMSTFTVLPETPLPPTMLPEKSVLDDVPVSRWEPAYEFTRRVTPPEVAAYRPVEVGAYKESAARSAVMNLFTRLAGDMARRLYLRVHEGDRKGDTVVGVVGYQARTRPGGICTCTPRIDSDHAQGATPLLAATLATLRQRSPGRRIEVTVDEWQPAMLAAAETLRCTLLRRSHAMSIKL